MSLAVYELTTLEIKVFSNAAVYEALKRELPGAGGELLGVFASDIGDLSRVLVLRRFDSGDACAQARLQLLLQKNPLGCGENVIAIRSESFALFPFLPAPQATRLGRWYEFRTYHLRQGTLAETIEAWKDAVPARVAMSPMLGAFAALDGEQPRFLNVWAYDSLEDRARIRGEAVQKGVWPPKGGPANLTRMASVVCAPVAI